MNHKTRIRRWLLTAVAAIAMLQGANAVPAYPGKMRVKQADGTYITCYLRGDEFSHQMFTADGYPVVFNEKTGNYEFANALQGRIVSSGIIARNAGQRSAQAQAYLKSVNLDAFTSILNQRAKDNRQSLKKAQAARAPRKVTTAQLRDMRISDIPTTGDQKALVILVQFSDQEFSSGEGTNQLWKDKLNKVDYNEGDATGSAFDYFHLCSDGRYNPEFVTVGPVTLKHTVAYYGSNSYQGDDYERVGEMVRDACQAAADSVDFSEFDADNDGKVDNVYFIYAGYGEADSYYSNTIWPHSYYYTELVDAYSTQLSTLTLNGKQIDRYTMSQEINGSDDKVVGIGTFIHEYGHVLGLADHYNTENSYATGQLDNWDVEASGSYNNNQNTPPVYSGFERASLGWLEPTELKPTTKGTIGLPCLSDSNFVYCVNVPGKDNEFFLLENRQQKGWDTYLPGHGMLVWHVDYNASAWANNTVNNNASHMRLDIVRADGRATSSTMSGDPFPGTRNVKEFGFVTWGGDTLFSFVDVAENSDSIAFMLGGSQFDISAPDHIYLTDSAGTSLTIAWDRVDHATTYDVRFINGTDTTTYSALKDTTLTLTGLQPETAYGFQVRSNISKYSSEYRDTVFTTMPLQFYERRITADSATNVAETSFTANWEAVPTASDYLFTLYKKTLTGSGEVTYDFTKSVANMPKGWTSSSSATSHSLYGESSPSLRLSRNGQYLEMDAVGDSLIQGVKFWWAGNRSGNHILVQVDSADTWKTVDSLATSPTGQTAEYQFDNAAKVRLLYVQTIGTGYACLDDITCTYLVMNSSKVEGYDSLSVGNVTSLAIADLEPATQYAYTLVATDGTYFTPVSNRIDVTTASHVVDAIEAVTADDSAAEVYDLTGKKVSLQSARAGVYIVRKGNKVYKVVKR